MSNKPLLPNAYVDFLKRNLGNTPTKISGVMCFAGIAVEGSEAAETIVSVGNLNEVAQKIGLGELADTVLEFFKNQGKKALVYRVEPTTPAVLGAVSKTPVSTSTGAVTIGIDGSEIVTNDFALKIEIAKTGDDGVAKFKYSTDNGVHFSPVLIVPVATTYVIPTTNIEVTFTKGAGPIFWEIGDVFTATVGAPVITNAKIEDALDAFIASNQKFDAIAVSVPSDVALATSFASKLTTAEGKPKFRYAYGMIRPALSTSASQAVTQATALMAGIADGRIQVITGEQIISRPNHDDQSDKSIIGIVAGRRSSLNISEDVGVVAAGQLFGVVDNRTGWTETTIEDLDGIYTVTLREFDGLAGWYVTNGYMSDPFNDAANDSFRLVLDKAGRVARIAAVQYVKVKVRPTDVAGSTNGLKSAIENDLNLMVGDDEIVDRTVVIPDGQDILTAKEIKVNVSVIPFGHADFIGIEVGLINPLRVAS